LKICDFGISKIIKENEMILEKSGTPAYIAPEVLNEEGYSGFASDYWSLGGCINSRFICNVIWISAFQVTTNERIT